MGNDSRLYVKAEIETVELCCDDVITTSGFSETEGGSGGIGADMNKAEW